ncbi:MAG: hypothetical protein ACK46X_19890, partial [Candidatus Sericytochromatia bacterium]
ASWLVAPLALGCVDPPPPVYRPEQSTAADSASGWGPLASGSRLGATVGDVRLTTDWDEPDTDRPSGLEIDDIALSTERLSGAESFFVTVRVTAPRGEHFRAYGLKTPYEEGIHAFSALPMAMKDGLVRIKVDPFSTMPVAGRYPLEFWLINDRKEPSNRLTGEVLVQ